MTLLWEGPFGAVSELARPSWFMAELWRREPAASSAQCETYVTTHPSHRTYPSALASSVLQRPSLANIPAWCKQSEVPCFNTKEPHTKDSCMSCAQIMLLAACNATREDEHAVSTDKHGPFRSRT